MVSRMARPYSRCSKAAPMLSPAATNSLVELRGIQRAGQLAVEALADEAGAAAGQVHDLAHQVGVHPRDEVVEVEVDVVEARARA